jgi:hypothetical protein
MDHALHAYKPEKKIAAIAVNLYFVPLLFESGIRDTKWLRKDQSTAIEGERTTHETKRK